MYDTYRIVEGMEKKHVVITGGASGLGLGCAARFRALGYHVTIADLNREGAARAVAALAAGGPADARLQAETLDLADPDSVAAFAQRLRARGEPVDVLVNNAGIYPPARRRLSPEGHELTFAIAHLGHFRLTHALWPLLEQAEAARVISISSLVQRRAQLHFDDLTFAQAYEPIVAYQQAKLACLLFALELQRRLDAGRRRIASYAAHPGVCRTQIGHNRARSSQDNAWQRLATAGLSFGLRYVGQSPERGAEPIVAVATGARFTPGSFVGPRWLFESFGPVGVSPLGPAARDAALATRLWQHSEALTGLRWNL
ncbi:SDR family NAD(P)-dependent oxidoreductase [Solimonas variicoloris]|uniref:SDR family NAD(P)-dependent oxidoreductase n=1 Tax=Solimonas variicoloris TaxID=254408 RepID=UPI001FDF4301|nr:SDR family NAD(P)-dependent oxidoreductase [Solimonas variicoloris]